MYYKDKFAWKMTWRQVENSFNSVVIDLDVKE